MVSLDKPFLIIPKFVLQPTWGGDYIAKLKHLDSKMRIGQSYELYGESELFDEGRIVKLNDLVDKDPEGVLGKLVYGKYGKMPLLIKINQATGNSFQLHIKQGVKHPRWQPKPESWYFLEDGAVTGGIRKGAPTNEYKAVCIEIDKIMHRLSEEVLNGVKTLSEAREVAERKVSGLNPWQFVEGIRVKKGETMDLSQGGIHHSWEEVVAYEVQLDVKDEVSTIRSFDRGRILDNGSIREVNIDDYFDFLDVNGDIEQQVCISTNNYLMEVVEISEKTFKKTVGSFHHIYAREGSVKIESDGGRLILNNGQSCFIPERVDSFWIEPNEGRATLLETYANYR